MYVSIRVMCRGILSIHCTGVARVSEGFIVLRPGYDAAPDGPAHVVRDGELLRRAGSQGGGAAVLRESVRLPREDGGNVLCTFGETSYS